MMRGLILTVILLVGCGRWAPTERVVGNRANDAGTASIGREAIRPAVLGLRDADAGAVKAYDFELTDTFGEAVRLGEYRGRVVALQFWAVWCSSCEADLLDFQSIHEQFADRDVTILGLAHASGFREDVAKYADSLGVEFPMLLCAEEVRTAYDVAVFPTTFLIDREGRVRLRRTGRLSRDYWQSAIEALLAEG